MKCCHVAFAIAAVIGLASLAANGHAADVDASWIEATLRFSAAEPAPAQLPDSTRPRLKPTIQKSSQSVGTAKGARVPDDDCVPASLRRALDAVEATVGEVSITSTCRSRSQNAAAGGAPHSLHLSGEAVDFRVSRNAQAALTLLARHPDVGGYKHYGGGLFHIDTGPHRTF
jgi:Peptidase M15